MVYYEISGTTRERIVRGGSRRGTIENVFLERKESKGRAKVGNKIELLSLLSAALRKHGRARVGRRVDSLSCHVHPRSPASFQDR